MGLKRQIDSAQTAPIAQALVAALSHRNKTPTADLCTTYASHRFARPAVARRVSEVYNKAADTNPG